MCYAKFIFIHPFFTALMLQKYDCLSEPSNSNTSIGYVTYTSHVCLKTSGESYFSTKYRYFPFGNVVFKLEFDHSFKYQFVHRAWSWGLDNCRTYIKGGGGPPTLIPTMYIISIPRWGTGQGNIFSFCFNVFIYPFGADFEKPNWDWIEEAFY